MASNQHVSLSGASLNLTAVLCHGHGCWMYLSACEGIGCGSSWNWEAVAWDKPGFPSLFFFHFVKAIHAFNKLNILTFNLGDAIT